MKVQGRVAVVTGAAQGIGLELSARLCAAGAKVLMVDVCEEARGEGLAKKVDADGPGQARFFRADMTDMDQVRRALEEPKRAFGQAGTIVCLNAGMVVKDDDATKVVKMIELNTTSVIVGSQIAADLIKADGLDGVIINTASMAGITPVPSTPAYAGSKWAVVGYTLSCRGLAKSHNVRVNCICPTLVDTPAVGGFFKEEFSKGPKVLRAVVDNFLTPANVVDAFMAVIADDNLVASAVGVMPEKVFVHDPSFARVIGQVTSPKVPDFVKSTNAASKL